MLNTNNKINNSHASKKYGTELKSLMRADQLSYHFSGTALLHGGRRTAFKKIHPRRRYQVDSHEFNSVLWCNRSEIEMWL